MMRGLVSVDEVMASLSEERREKIEARGKKLIAHIEQRKAVQHESSKKRKAE